MRDDHGHRLPDFLILGTAKAGTTSIARYLQQHPGVFIPEKKECRFFSRMEGNFSGPGDEKVNASIIRDIGTYSRLFEEAAEDCRMGDASPDYLFHYENFASEVSRHYPKDLPQMFVVLRDPVTRAYSQYMHFVRDGRETLSFREAMDLESKRQADHYEWAWSYKEIGRYHEQLGYLVDRLGRERIHVYLYEDFQADSVGLLGSICEVLELPPHDFDVGEKHNVSGIPRYNRLYQFMRGDSRQKAILKRLAPKAVRRSFGKRIQKDLVKRPMEDEDRAYLREFYREDIESLQALTGRDLTSWLG